MQFHCTTTHESFPDKILSLLNVFSLFSLSRVFCTVYVLRCLIVYLEFNVYCYIFNLTRTRKQKIPRPRVFAMETLPSVRAQPGTSYEQQARTQRSFPGVLQSTEECTACGYLQFPFSVCFSSVGRKRRTRARG